MFKAEIINLTSEFFRHNQSESSFCILQKHLRILGIDSKAIFDISDNPDNFTEKISDVFSANDIIIIIGGLGNHLNDLVKQTLIEKFSLKTEFNQAEYEKSKKLYQNIPDDLLHKFCEYPKGCKFLNSDEISGFAMEIKDRLIICLPSEPLEIYNVFSEQVLPYLAQIIKPEYITEKTLFPGIDFTECRDLTDKLSDGNVCVSVHDMPEGIFITATGLKESVENVMCLCDEKFSKSIMPKKYINKLNTQIEQKQKLDITNTENTKNNKKGLLVFLLIIFIICGAVSGGYIGYNYYAAYINEKNNNKLQELVDKHSSENSQENINNSSSNSTVESSEISQNSDPNSKNILPLFNELYSKNNDIKGWIKIDDTKINYPVMQYTDNEFYLKNDFDKKNNKYGIPFLDYENDIEDRDKNIIIYGHNMNDGQMFGDLIKYRNLDFYKKHPVIEFNSLYEKGKYKIIGGFITNTRPEHGEPFDYHNKINFETEEEFYEFIDDIKIRSFFDAPVDVAVEDNLLTLSTCTYEFTGARFVLVAREIRDGESEEVDVSKAKSNNPLLPDVWYELFGGKSPYAIETETNQDKETSNSNVSSENIPNQSSDITEKNEISSSQESESNLSEQSVSSEENSSNETSSEKTEISKDEISSSQIIDIISPDLPEESKSSSDAENNSDLPEETSSSASSNRDDGLFESPEVSQTEEKIESDDESDEKFDDESNENDYYPSDDIMDEVLKLSVNGKKIKMNAYDAICQIVENETRGNMHNEAIKAQVVASYTYVKYNNAKGLYAQVGMNSKVSKAVENAVSEVLGQMMRYNGSIINATYHSTSRGITASSKSVWGTALPYLVPVESPYDKLSPYYKSTFSISKDDFAELVFDTYGIDLYEEDIPYSEWIYIDEDRLEPGGYVGVVKIGGYDMSQGGTVGTGNAITGRNVREKLLNFNIKSTSFEVKYSNGKFVFTSYGYGHGVGMSQWGAQGMAENGYDYEEILTHYYTGAVLTDY